MKVSSSAPKAGATVPPIRSVMNFWKSGSAVTFLRASSHLAAASSYQRRVVLGSCVPFSRSPLQPASTAAPAGNDFKNVLPIFSFHGVGWFHWGLVEGKTQTYYPWTSKQGAAKPEIWEQDILREDGSAYDEEEIRMIKGFEFD